MALIRERVVLYGSTAWGQSRAFRDADIERIMARVIPVVQAGQMQAAQVTNAYIGRLAVLAGVTWTPGVDRDAIIDYRGIPAEEVYRRPAVATYSALAKGTPYLDAVKVGAARLVGIIATDMQQASNRQASAAIAGSGFSAFRRQLSGRENCAFCVIASTQRYLKGDLLPLHPACDCETMPLLSATDPGQVINRNLLEMTHAAIDKQLGFTDRGARDLDIGKVSSSGQPLSDYTDLIVVNDHGELGPVLGWRGAKFTGADDLHSH
ncbi:hypothetical protein E3T43_07160 [Cryobacterium sp. Hh7]|uniref:hypothetical protein n=1 Tax=Cryobacterium sp. Hh7 TaxID=1259159 RepID=UPI0010698A48|nr:hypothetical protein [Cryobacterium sp. Hh7]TFD58021.1 hypothetical protein E3T43_07160 [Cryobacterium sp. Hh7]